MKPLDACIPYDGGVDLATPLEINKTDLLNARIARLPLEIRERLNDMPIPPEDSIMIKLLVCDAFDFGRFY